MGKIIRTEDRVNNEVYTRYIFGLNTFRVNKVNQTTSLELKFLESVNQEFLLSAHTGSLHDLAESPKELFGEPNEVIFYEEVGIGVFGGKFYSIEDWLLFPPCFFPKANKDFWRIKDSFIETDLGEILGWDALALYVSPKGNNYIEAMTSLFKMKFISSEDWIRKVLEIYRLVILSAGDANFFKAYSSSPEDLELLGNSIENMEKIVIANTWYKDNESSLIWDDKNNMCLILPKKEGSK